MQELSFAIDMKALWGLIGLLLLAYFARHYFNQWPHPHFLFSHLQDLLIPSSQRFKIPIYLYWISITFFALAFIDPHFLLPRNFDPQPRFSSKEGLAIYLMLDQSGSMTGSIRARDVNGQTQLIEKMQLLKEMTKLFIEQRPSDLIGLVTFARIPQILSPLTLDQSLLQKQLSQLQVASTPDEDGTSIGYAIYKTAHLIAATRYFATSKQPAYRIKDALMIVVTDGLQDPNPLDQGNRLRTIELDEAAEYAKSQHIKLYIINLDPILASAKYAPHRRQLERITQLTGGQFYLLTDQENLQHIYDQIDQLEKVKIPLEIPPPKRWSLYPGLIALALICLLMACLLDLVIWRKAP
jgi:Ca-activated chloride channel family protein